MDQTTILIVAGSIVFTGLVFFIIFRSVKNKPLTMLSVIAEDKKNPGVYHIFGAASYMPDDGPSFEKYRHYLLNTADLKVIRGLEQKGSDFDIKSPFALRCIEHMKTLSGRDLKVKEEPEESDDDDIIEEKKLQIIEHDRDESDTMVQKKITGDAVEQFNTSFGESDQFALKIRLNGIDFSVPKVHGTMGITKVIWRKNEQKLFVFYNRMYFMKFGVGMLVLDTSNGTVITDDYFKAN